MKRFKKGQEIFKIDTISKTYSKRIVHSCGKKRLVLVDKIGRNDYEPFQEEGSIGNMVSIFHETEDSAIIELDKIR